jgi:hypothetical protein
VQHQLREYRKSHNHDVVQEEAVQELAMHPWFAEEQQRSRS